MLSRALTSDRVRRGAALCAGVVIAASLQAEPPRNWSTIENEDLDVDDYYDEDRWEDSRRFDDDPWGGEWGVTTFPVMFYSETYDYDPAFDDEWGYTFYDAGHVDTDYYLEYEYNPFGYDYYSADWHESKSSFDEWYDDWGL